MAHGRSDEASKEAVGGGVAGDKSAVDNGARALLITPVRNFPAYSRLSPAPFTASLLDGEGASRPDGEGASRPDGEGASQPDGDVASEDFDSQPTNPSQEHPDHQRLWDMSIDGSQKSDIVLESQSQ